MAEVKAISIVVPAGLAPMTGKASWAEFILTVFEDKAKHADSVAAEQTKRSNTEAADLATQRAAGLRQIAAPLLAQVEAEKEAREEVKNAAKLEKQKAKDAKAAERAALKETKDKEKAEAKAKKDAEKAAAKAEAARLAAENKAAKEEEGEDEDDEESEDEE